MYRRSKERWDRKSSNCETRKRFILSFFVFIYPCTYCAVDKNSHFSFSWKRNEEIKKVFFLKTTDTDDDDDNEGGKERGMKCRTLININEINNCKETRKAKVFLCIAHAWMNECDILSPSISFFLEILNVNIYKNKIICRTVCLRQKQKEKSMNGN